MSKVQIEEVITDWFILNPRPPVEHILDGVHSSSFLDKKCKNVYSNCSKKFFMGKKINIKFTAVNLR